MKREDAAIEALQNAVSNQSTMNYDAIVKGFHAKGIPVDDIVPRQNIFTFNAWRALGRTVRKGEHGVKVVAWIKCTKTDKKTGEVSGFRRPKATTVFHISQTEELTAQVKA